MRFQLTATIACPRRKVFDFFATIHEQQRDPESVVPVYEMVTAGPFGVGSRIREVVRLPFGRAMEIWSEVVFHDPPHRLAYTWTGPGMSGELEYTFIEQNGGTAVMQVHTLVLHGWLRLMGPVMYGRFGRAIDARLKGIAEQLGEKELGDGVL